MRVLALGIALFLAVLASPAYSQESSREDFRDFCKAFEGRWVGDVTWVADWAAYGKRGDKVTAYFEGKIIEDGNAFMGRFFGGTGSGTSLVMYDAGAKRIKWIWINSGGSASQDIVFRDGKNWVSKSVGCTADGTKTEYLSTITVSDDGNTHTWTGSGKVGGKKVDDQHDVWRRVSNK